MNFEVGKKDKKDEEIRNREFICVGCNYEVKVVEGIDIHNLGIENINGCFVCQVCFLGYLTANFQKISNKDSILLCPNGD